MRDGRFRDDEGFEILHNGVSRTFRDDKATAYAAAGFARQRNPDDIVEIRVRATGQRIVMLADGRTG